MAPPTAGATPNPGRMQTHTVTKAPIPKAIPIEATQEALVTITITQTVMVVTTTR